MSYHAVRRLSPVLGVSRFMALTFAVIASVSSVFLMFGTAFQTVGTLINLAVMVQLRLPASLPLIETGSNRTA